MPQWSIAFCKMAPLKTLLSALSHLPGVGKYAKTGLDLLNKGLEGVSDFADKASAKAKALSANLDKFNKPISIKFGKIDILSGIIEYKYASTCRTNDDLCSFNGTYYEERKHPNITLSIFQSEWVE